MWLLVNKLVISFVWYVFDLIIILCLLYYPHSLVLTFDNKTSMEVLGKTLKVLAIPDKTRFQMFNSGIKW